MRQGTWVVWMVVVGLANALSVTRAAASPDVGHAEIRATILLRALAYEQGLGSSPAALRIAVVGSRDNSDMLQAFEHLAGTLKVANRPLVPVGVAPGSPQEILSALRAAHADIVYVPEHAGDVLDGLDKALAAQPSIVMCGDPGDVGRGCMLALEQSSGKARVVIHLGLAQKMGLHFDGRLLQLARVVQ